MPSDYHTFYRVLWGIRTLYLHLANVCKLLMHVNNVNVIDSDYHGIKICHAVNERDAANYN